MDELIQLNGKDKSFLDWCSDYGVSPLQVRALVSLGVPLEKALLVKEHRRIVLIQMNGQTKALSAWCKQYGIAPSTVKKRIAAGCTLQQAFESGKYQTHKVRSAAKITAQEYTITKPFLSWCADYLANPLYVRAAMSMGSSLEYALKNAHKGRINQLVMQVEGTTDTFLHFCSQYGKASNTIRRRVGLGFSLGDAFGLPHLQKGETDRLLELGKANENHSITQSLSGWCRDYNVPQKTAEQRLRMGMTIEQALAPQQQETLQLGEKDVALGDLCARLGLDVGAVKRRITRGMSILEEIYNTAGHKLDGRIPIDGGALKRAREKAGFSPSRLAEQVNQRGDFTFTKYTIHSLEQGKRQASQIEYQTLAAVLDCTSLRRKGEVANED